MNAVGGGWSGFSRSVPSNSMGSATFNNPEIAAIGRQSQDAAATNLQGAQVMQQTLRDFKDGKVSMMQLLDVYDELRASGAKGGPMEAMDKVLWRASNARRIGDPSGHIAKEIRNGIMGHGREAFAPLPQLPPAAQTGSANGSLIEF